MFTTDLNRIEDVSVLAPFPRRYLCSVVFQYVMQYTSDNTDEAVEKSLWSKRGYAKLSASILAVGWFFEFNGRSIMFSCILWKFFSH